MAGPLNALWNSAKSVVAGAGVLASAAASAKNSPVGQVLGTTAKLALAAEAGRELSKFGPTGEDISNSQGLNYIGGVPLGVQAALERDGAFKHKIFITNNYVGVQESLWVSAWLPEQVSLDISATYQRAFGEGLMSGGGFVNNAIKAFGFSGVSREMSFKVWESTQGITMQIPLIFSLDDTRPMGDSDRDLHAAILKLQKLVAPSQTTGASGQKSFFLTPPGSTYRFKKTTAESTNQAAQQSDVADNSLVTPQNSVDTAQTSESDTDNPILELFGSALDSLGGAVDSIAEGRAISDAVTGISEKLQSIIDTDLELLTWTSVYIGNFLYFKHVVIDSVSTAYDMRMDANGRPIRATVNVQFTTLFDVTVQDLNAIYKINDATQATAAKVQ